MPSDRAYLKIGNARTVVWDGRKTFKAVATSDLKVDRFLWKGLREVWCVSVVPSSERQLRKWVKKKGLKLNKILLRDIPVKPAYVNGLGTDRLLNLFGVQHLTSRNFVVMDMGTALTVDFFCARDERHLGGWILSGPHLMSRALHFFTAKLPKVKPTRIRTLGARPGRSTKDSLAEGQHAYLSAMILEVRRVARKLFRGPFEIFITGGGATLLPPSWGQRVEHLSLKALKALSDHHHGYSKIRRINT